MAAASKSRLVQVRRLFGRRDLADDPLGLASGPPAAVRPLFVLLFAPSRDPSFLGLPAVQNYNICSQRVLSIGAVH
jgi:hypothetical protein